ncbi:MBL fold metallo-hydrolase [Jeongeupia naejangsanensis]|uniref:MBL fold metallo-hydrolase n=1 Tax=Jeongeupia naejangsanensis TaxID=613195 RepID=A0ABS2BKK5_9NEIS|nr:MBL fold metallo-hydrolase [Jeongeupia naejangsanensis]MBM3116147.1 MBL fold metallo-hydrolase [Jeongeupia naejangsanensis]
MFKFAPATAALVAAGAVSFAVAATPALKVDVYNPGSKSIFPVSSELVTGKKEAVLIDAQFQRNDAEALVKKIRASGKTLTTIYISHSDPDFYFGLDTLKAAFPNAKIVATPQTVEKIRASMDGKLAYWGPILKDNAPKSLVLPEVLKGDSITLEGRQLKVVGLDGATPDHTFVWIPSAKTVTGGVVVFGNMHVWVADNQTPVSRQNWYATLKQIEALKPKTVIPGHFVGDAPMNLKSVAFTRDYLQAFETEATKAKDAAALIGAMDRLYLQFGRDATLEISAKVIKGEMKWPQ